MRGKLTESIPLKLFLDMVSSSFADNVTTRFELMFSWRMIMPVEPREGSTRATFSPRLAYF